MFDIGFLELMVVGVLGLLVLGPERLPKAARTAGLFVGRIRRTLNNIQDDLERQVRTEELREKLKDPYATFMDDTMPSNPDRPQAPPEGLPENPQQPTALPQQAAAGTPAADNSPQDATPDSEHSKPS
ncbi:MAG: Sec-independent protein translocase protein TatB [Pseudomonadota bacterium]|nr:Sec-independent protein translocase protein TatB [Pseudomonadota bacterium]